MADVIYNTAEEASVHLKRRRKMNQQNEDDTENMKMQSDEEAPAEVKAEEESAAPKRRRKMNQQNEDDTENMKMQFDEEVPAEVKAVESKKPRRRIFKKMKRLHEHGMHDDIRYRGPLSFQSFQALGWFCIIMSVVMILLKIRMKITPDQAESIAQRYDLLGYIPAMSLPFMLIANFSRILNNEEGYWKQLLRTGLSTFLIVLIFNLFFYRYVVGVVSLISMDTQQVMPLIMGLVKTVTPHGFVSFNIFIDLFLCTLFMFFLFYKPKKIFTGKLIFLFRLFAILPVGYEFGSILLKVACANGQVVIPIWAFPLLTVKPPMTFVVFMLMVIFLKFRELRFCRHGRTHEEYEEFLQTNRNSLHFSIFLMVMLVIAAVADLIIMLVMIIQQAGSLEAFEQLDINNFHAVAVAVGFGKSIPLILISPIMLFYSYTRKPRFEKIGTLLPMVSMVVIVLIVIQGVYQLLIVAGLPRIDFNELKQTLESMLMLMMQ